MSTQRSWVIVVGYDGSQPSRAALGVAARHAHQSGLIYVVHAVELPPDFLGSPNSLQMLTERMDQGRELLAAVPALVTEAEPGPEYITELIGGPPAKAIADVASARDADVIIVGARGLGRVRALLGSVSHELLHIADRPVLVIPAAAVEHLQSVPSLPDASDSADGPARSATAGRSLSPAVHTVPDGSASTPSES